MKFFSIKYILFVCLFVNLLCAENELVMPLEEIQQISYASYKNAPSSNQNTLEYLSYFEIAAGKQIGVNQSFTTVGILTSYPVSICSYQLKAFADMSWSHFFNGANGMSFEGGLSWKNTTSFLSGYIGYDFRRSHKHVFDQISTGLQVSGDQWEVILNLSFPIRKKSVVCSSSFTYKEGYKGSVKTFEEAFQMTSLILSHSFCIGHNPSIRFSAGFEPYYISLNKKNFCKSDEKSWGKKGRLHMKMWNFLNAEFSFSHDKIFNTCSQFLVSIEILNLFSNCNHQSPSSKTFHRQKAVPIKGHEKWTYNW